MTPFVRAGEENRRGQCQWNLEDARVKLRGEIARRTRLGDHHLYVVEGVPLLPLSGFSDKSWTRRVQSRIAAALTSTGAGVPAALGLNASQLTIVKDCMHSLATSRD